MTLYPSIFSEKTPPHFNTFPIQIYAPFFFLTEGVFFQLSIEVLLLFFRSTSLYSLT